MTTAPIFTLADVGCHADHSFGWQHVRDTLADLVDAVDNDRLREDDTCRLTTSAALHGPPPDDYGDEYEALEILQGATVDGLVWVIDQDLLLIPNDNE